MAHMVFLTQNTLFHLVLSDLERTWPTGLQATYHAQKRVTHIPIPIQGRKHVVRSTVSSCTPGGSGVLHIGREAVVRKERCRFPSDKIAVALDVQTSTLEISFPTGPRWHVTPQPAGPQKSLWSCQRDHKVGCGIAHRSLWFRCGQNTWRFAGILDKILANLQVF